MYDDRVVTLSELNVQTGINLPTQLSAILTSEFSLLEKAVTEAAGNTQIGQRSNLVRYCAPYYDPPKILGIGLNYREHAGDLGAQQPLTPASFMKPRTTIIGHEDSIVIPSESKRVTAEAELGLIIGKRCKHVREDDVASVIFGYVPILDMTAEDIL